MNHSQAIKPRQHGGLSLPVTTRPGNNRRPSAVRKTLYELSRLHSQGLLNREDYLEARRVLISDILGGRQALNQGHYATLGSSDDSTVQYSEAVIAERRREARQQHALLKEFRDYTHQVRRTRQRNFCRLAASMLVVILVGVIWYIWL